MKNPKFLYLITAEYPYGIGETFIENEIKVLAKRFEKVCLIPLCKEIGVARQIPDNVFVEKTLMRSESVKMSHVFFQNIHYILKLLFLEFIHTNKKLFFILNIKKVTAYLCVCISLSKKFHFFLKLEKEKKKFTPLFYSFWMDEGALMLSVLKDKKVIDSFVFRVLGYDLYDERRVGGYMPFRYFNFKMTKKIFCISNDGYQYLKQKKMYPEKLTLSYLSVFDNGVNPFDINSRFTLVSCSNLIPLKRVHLIIEILKNVTIDLHWIHFGEGSLKKELLMLSKQLPANIEVDFKGQQSNTDILNFYKNQSVNLFIHVSETEGGAPVALQEAASFGIPLIGTNAGGIPEIVTPQTGILVPIDFNVMEVSEIINNFKASDRNTRKFRDKTKAYWKENFNAEINYSKLCDQILN